MDLNKKYYRLSQLSSMALLFLAILPIWPYAFYQLVRLVVCSTCIYILYTERHKSNWYILLFVLLAFLFNPIFPLYIAKDVWPIFDFLAGVILVVNYYKLNQKKSLGGGY